MGLVKNESEKVSRPRERRRRGRWAVAFVQSKADDVAEQRSLKASPDWTLLDIVKWYFWGFLRAMVKINVSNMDGSAVANAAKELIGLCRAGKLYEVEKWIADGKSIDISEAIKRGRHQRNCCERR